MVLLTTWKVIGTYQTADKQAPFEINALAEQGHERTRWSSPINLDTYCEPSKSCPAASLRSGSPPLPPVLASWCLTAAGLRCWASPPSAEEFRHASVWPPVPYWVSPPRGSPVSLSGATSGGAFSSPGSRGRISVAWGTGCSIPHSTEFLLAPALHMAEPQSRLICLPPSRLPRA